MHSHYAKYKNSRETQNEITEKYFFFMISPADLIH
jgi:hypothetical protein